MTKYLSKQQIFDVIFDRLWVQGRPSMKNFSCLYRGPGGLKCGIGHIISDEYYNVGMETYSCDSHLVWPAIPSRYKESPSFLKDIQQKFHDDFKRNAAPSFRHWLNEAGAIFSETHNLNFTPREITQ